ncbi:MAG TPA: hypothetical protein VGC87_12610 [Pyrinomonadaceae bacterium]|jgi:hypothetical protein
MLLLAAVLVGAASVSTIGQRQTARGTDAELAAASKKAILETGISEQYFDRHFRLARVVAEEGDRRVEWKFSVSGYEVLLVDDVGYHTSDAGERVDVHSIKSELFSAHDIKRTIPKRRARAALKSCIGKYTDATLVYRALKAPGKAGLYLTARAKVEIDDEGEDGEREGEGESGREVEGVSFNVGFVNLETGKCTVEKGQVTP